MNVDVSPDDADSKPAPGESTGEARSAIRARGEAEVRLNAKLWPAFVAGAWWLVMFTLTHWPKLEPPKPFRLTFHQADKVAHFVIFFGWFLLWSWALKHIPRPHRHPHAVLLAVGTAYAVFDELTQAYVVGRSASLLDFLADLAGMLTAMGLIHWRRASRAPNG